MMENDDKVEDVIPLPEPKVELEPTFSQTRNVVGYVVLALLPLLLLFFLPLFSARNISEADSSNEDLLFEYRRSGGIVGYDDIFRVSEVGDFVYLKNGVEVSSGMLSPSELESLRDVVLANVEHELSKKVSLYSKIVVNDYPFENDALVTSIHAHSNGYTIHIPYIAEITNLFERITVSEENSNDTGPSALYTQEDEIPTATLVEGDNIVYRHNEGIKDGTYTIKELTEYIIHTEFFTIDSLYVVVYNDPKYSDILARSQKVSFESSEDNVLNFVFDKDITLNGGDVKYFELRIDARNVSNSSRISVARKALETRVLEAENYTWGGFN